FCSLFGILRVDGNPIPVSIIIVVRCKKAFAAKISKAAIATSVANEGILKRAEIIAGSIVAGPKTASASPQHQVFDAVFGTATRCCLSVGAAPDRGKIAAKSALKIVVMTANCIHNAAESIAAVKQG